MVNKMNKRRARMRHLAATILLSCHFCSSYIPAKILSAPQRSHHRSTASPSTSHLARKRTIRQRDGFEFLDSIVLLAVKLNEEKVVNETSSGVYFADTENSGGREVVMLKPKLNGVAKKSSDMNGKTNSFAVRETENDSNTNGSKVSLDKETEPENDSTIGSIFYRKYRGIKASNPNQGSIKKFGLGEVVVNGDHAEGSDGENRRTSRFGKAWSPLKKIYTQVKRLKPGSTEGSSESSSTHRIWRRRHARTLEEGIRRETSEGQSELPERKAQLSSLLDRAQIDARKSHHRRYVERTLMGLINALAQEIEDLDVDINSNPDTPIWRKELKELRISFSRMGFKPLQMGGSNMARFQTETDYAEESEQQLPLVECADEAFDRLDVDGSGTLDREEIAQALSMISGLQTDKESINDLAAELVDLYDEDKNGVVDREEYQQMVEDMAALQAKNKDENGPLNAMKKSVQSISQGISKKAAQVAAAAKRSSSSDDDFDDFDELEMGSITMSNINLDLRQLLFGNLPFIKKVSYKGNACDINVVNRTSIFTP